jgi:hypothetical protein
MSIAVERLNNFKHVPKNATTIKVVMINEQN